MDRELTESEEWEIQCPVCFHLEDIAPSGYEKQKKKLSDSIKTTTEYLLLRAELDEARKALENIWKVAGNRGHSAHTLASIRFECKDYFEAYPTNEVKG